MTALKQPNFISVSDYLASEEVSDVKHESLGGSIDATAGATYRQYVIAGNSFASLHGKLRRKPCQPFNSDTKVRIEFPEHTRLYFPDAMVVCRLNPDSAYFRDQPVVIIEVLSDSTRRTDLGEKRDAYLTIPSLKVLIFVEPDATLVTNHRRKLEGGFEIEQHQGLENTIALAKFDAWLPSADPNERVDFAIAG